MVLELEREKVLFRLQKVMDAIRQGMSYEYIYENTGIFNINGAYCDKGWEWYSVTPYSKKRCIRIRLGWKIKGDKYKEGSVAPLVFTINPFDTCGDD